MIKLYSLKQHKKDGETPKTGNQKKASAAQLRITKGEFYNIFKKYFCFFLCRLYISQVIICFRII